jgi:hypothetical protein
MAVDPGLALSLEEPLLDAEQAAALLNVRPSYPVGRHLRFTRPMLEQWAAAHRIENAETGARYAARTRRSR